jgi:hypothetical protein
MPKSRNWNEDEQLTTNYHTIGAERAEGFRGTAEHASKFPSIFQPDELADLQRQCQNPVDAAYEYAEQFTNDKGLQDYYAAGFCQELGISTDIPGKLRG